MAKRNRRLQGNAHAKNRETIAIRSFVMSVAFMRPMTGWREDRSVRDDRRGTQKCGGVFDVSMLSD